MVRMPNGVDVFIGHARCLPERRLQRVQETGDLDARVADASAPGWTMSIVAVAPAAIACGGEFRNDFPVRVQNLLPHVAVRGGESFTTSVLMSTDRLFRRNLRRCHKRPIPGDVQRIGHHDANIAINPPAEDMLTRTRRQAASQLLLTRTATNCPPACRQP